MTNSRHCDAPVMVVEDDLAIRESIAEALEDCEYEVIQIGNGREAIERLRAASTKPCVILLDIMMPEMDGWQFRAFQKQDPELMHIPIVVLSAYTSIDEIETVMQPAACLRKPIRLEAMMEIVERICQGRA